MQIKIGRDGDILTIGENLVIITGENQFDINESSPNFLTITKEKKEKSMDIHPQYGNQITIK